MEEGDKEWIQDQKQSLLMNESDIQPNLTLMLREKLLHIMVWYLQGKARKNKVRLRESPRRFPFLFLSSYSYHFLNRRVSLRGFESGPVLELSDKDDIPRAELALEDNNTRLDLSDEKGKTCATLQVGEGGPSMNLVGKKSTARTSFECVRRWAEAGLI